MKKLLKILVSGTLLFGALSSQAFAAETAWISSLANFDGGTGMSDATLRGITTSDYQTSDDWVYEAGNTAIALSSAVTRDGTKAYIAGDLNGASEEIKIITTVTGVTTSLTLPNNSQPSTVVLNQDESRLYVTTFGNEVYVIDTNSLTVVATIDNTNDPAFSDTRWLGIAPNGDIWVVALNSGSESLFKIDANTNTVVAGPFQMPKDADDLATRDYIAGAIVVSQDNSKVYINCRIEFDDGISPRILEDSLCIYDINANTYSHIGDQVISDSPSFDPLEDLAMSSDGTKLYKSSFYNNTVSIFDLETDSLITRQTTGDSPIGVDITADGSKVFIVNSRLSEAEAANDFTMTSTVSVLSTSSNAIIHTASLPGGFSFANGTFIGGAAAENAGEGVSPEEPASAASLADTGMSQLAALFITLSVVGFTGQHLLKRLKQLK